MSCEWLSPSDAEKKRRERFMPYVEDGLSLFVVRVADGGMQLTIMRDSIVDYPSYSCHFFSRWPRALGACAQMATYKTDRKKGTPYNHTLYTPRVCART